MLSLTSVLPWNFLSWKRAAAWQRHLMGHSRLQSTLRMQLTLIPQVRWDPLSSRSLRQPQGDTDDNVYIFPAVGVYHIPGTSKPFSCMNLFNIPSSLEEILLTSMKKFRLREGTCLRSHNKVVDGGLSSGSLAPGAPCPGTGPVFKLC